VIVQKLAKARKKARDRAVLGKRIERSGELLGLVLAVRCQDLAEGVDKAIQVLLNLAVCRVEEFPDPGRDRLRLVIEMLHEPATQVLDNLLPMSSSRASRASA
jgi:hypothetical protein